jgi:hypothetical protein
MRVIFAQLLLSSGLRLALQSGSPVEKVVELIKELKTKIEADGANEQKVYDKFACWCESTTARLADSITAEKANIGTQTTGILTAKGAVAVYAHEIATHQADIAKNEHAMKGLTKVREEENGDYQETKSYMETTLTALHQAIEVLNGAGTKKVMGLLKVASKVRSAILDSPNLSSMPEKQSKILKNFLEDPASFLQDSPEEDYYDQKAQAKASYAPQSATVTGILKDMYDTFSADLEKSNKEESASQKAFEDEIAIKTSQNKALQELVTNKEVKKSEQMDILAVTEEDLANEQSALTNDEAIFIAARDQCKAKSDSWDERCRLRSAELDGIQKALEILTSDDARDMFLNATSTRAIDTFGSEGVDVDFLQLEESASSPRAKAYRTVKKLIGGHKENLRLARLAVSIRTATTGHFDDVISSIDTMIGTLKDEGAKDVEQRDWCIAERHAQNMNKDEYAYQIDQLEGSILRAETDNEKLQDKVDKTLQAIDDTTETYEEAEADRVRENGAYLSAKAADVAAIGLLADAVAALSAYGEQQSDSFPDSSYSFVQVKQKAKQPVFEVSENQAPDATFSSGDSHAGAGKGIVLLLTQIKSDLENEVVLADKSEDKAVAEFFQMNITTTKQLAVYNKTVVDLRDAISKNDGDIVVYKSTKTDTTGQHTATVTYLDRIKPNCDWIMGAFEKRAAARAKEEEGLSQAKSMLAGADLGFLQHVQ